MPMSTTVLTASARTAAGQSLTEALRIRHEVGLVGVGASMQTLCGLQGNPARLAAVATDCPDCLSIRARRGTYSVRTGATRIPATRRTPKTTKPTAATA